MTCRTYSRVKLNYQNAKIVVVVRLLIARSISEEHNGNNEKTNRPKTSVRLIKQFHQFLLKMDHRICLTG